MNDRDLESRFAAARAIARDGGSLAMGYFRRRDTLEIVAKGPQDVVSQADREVEILIAGKLAALFPDDGFVGEEMENRARRGEGSGDWVVDPIDGTAGFVRGIPVWCVSLAFVVDGQVEIGVIYDPNVEEMFAARRGRGAALNGEPIHASFAAGFEDGSVGIGYSNRTGPRPAVAAIESLLAQGGMYYRNGSGALMLAYVAAGRLIGYYEAHINAWDCLAGVVLVREAGGWTNDFLADEGLSHGNVIAAAAPGLAPALRRLAGLE